MDPQHCYLSIYLSAFLPIYLSQEAVASSLVMKLQLMISRLNSALEDQCQNLVQSVPRYSALLRVLALSSSVTMLVLP